MSAAVEERAPSVLPHSSTSPAELPLFGPFPPREPSSADKHSQKTPTQATFNTESASSPMYTSDSNRDRINAHRSNPSLDSTVSDVKEEDADSDNESTASNSRPSKKKKGQRFYCTDYPPCNLSFTRSEHLARHIRKHTGERPFQCHCLRRFSRLDNLRQHAQTVHVNEEIPGDSLAATGTRFQRQVRTDRVRPGSHRHRASTLSASGAHSRGHSRNISNSSIGSISDVGTEDTRRRPAPIAIAQNTSPRSGLVLDTYAGSANPGEPPYYNYSPTGYSTPMSVYSANDVGSPVMQAHSLNSPITFVSRSEWAGRAPSHTRRLSVPTQPSLFQQAATSGTSGLFSSPTVRGQPPFSPIAGSVTSPTGSHFPDSRSTDQPGSPESVWKRRTWHPSAFTGTRPATSGLSYYQTPDAPQPVAANQPAAQQSIRLPGIDSFDRAHVQPQAPPRRPPSAMDIDEPVLREPSHSRTVSDAGSKRNSWNSINQHMHSMEIASQPPHGESGWHPTSAAIDQRPLTAPYGSTARTAGTTLPPSNQLKVLEPSAAPLVPGTAPQKPQLFAGEPGPAVVDSPVFRTSPAASACSDGQGAQSNMSAGEYQLAPVVTGHTAEPHVPPAHLVDDVSRDKLRSGASYHQPLPSFPVSQPSVPHIAFYPPTSHNPLDTLAAVAARNAEQGR